MADLKISELALLAGADLQAADQLAVADGSASETKRITVSDLVGNAVTLIADDTIPGAKILFGSQQIPGSALENGAVDTAQLADESVTAAKLADQSSVDLVTTLPGTGAFVGQIALDTDDDKFYCWDGTQWVSVKGAGSINVVSGSSTGVVNINVATTGDSVTISTSLDDTTNAAEFLAGPAGNGGTVGYRTITGDDLPTATSIAKGAVSVNGEGLRLDGAQIEIDKDISASATHHVVTYDAKGLISSGRAIASADLPVATDSAAGAIIPGSGLSVDGSGNLDHSNSATPGTYPKVTIDAQGHVTEGNTLEPGDLPDHSAALLTSGTLDIARIGSNAVTGTKIANYAVSKFGETAPTADHIGQFFFNPLSRDLFLWDGNVYQPIGISIGEIVFAGTFDASAGGGTGLVASVTSEGTSIGLVAGQALPAASENNSRYYLVVSEQGTITSGNAPQVLLSPPDILLSNGSEWTEVDVSQTVTSQVAVNVSFTPAGNIASTDVQSAIEELDSEKLSGTGGTISGELIVDTTGSFKFEGSSDNEYETAIDVVDPTADRTITLPDASGTVALSGSIANADIASNAAIAYSKLATLSSGNIVLGNSSNVATSTAITGDVTISNTGVTSIASGAIVNADINASAGIDYSKLATLTAGNVVLGNASNVATSTAISGDISISDSGVTSIAGGVIVNADINASAAIADTKLDTISTAGKVSGSAITSGTIGGSTAINTTGTITTTGQTTLKEIKETVYTLGTSGSIALDPANGSIQSSVLAGAPTFTDSLEAGQTIVLMLENGASYTVTWPTITWVTSAGNAAPTLTAKDTLVLWKVSTTLYGAYVGSYA